MACGKDAKLILESHWDTWISEDDWDWLGERGINTVRIPIGYYHICGADRTVLDGTDFFPYYNVYVGAWARIIQAIENAARRGIGVLLDLHAAPGKQNDDAHAGTSDRANFFNDPHNQKCTVHALRVLVNNIVSHQPPLLNVVGVELINEPRPPSDHALQSWYTFAMHELRSSKIPIYLGDCWRTEFYANYLVDERPSTLTVLDHHLYRCFTESDIRTSAESHTLSLADPNAETPVMLARAAEKLGRVGCGIVIGEWSGALNPGSLRGGTKEKEDYVRAQLDLFEEHCGGWFFWTYKKQDRGDTGWSLRDAVQAGIFPPWVGLKAKRSAIGDEGRWREARDGQKQRSLQLHAEYWKKLGISKHELFEAGFRDGWDDAYMFFNSQPDSAAVVELGFDRAWAYRKSKHHGKYYWEYEHGFLQGVKGARKDFEHSYC